MREERNIRRRNRQIKRRKQVRKRLFLLAGVAVLFILLLNIINLNVRLGKLKNEWQKIEIRSTQITRSDVQAQGAARGGSGTLELERPVERTEAEVLQRLEELGQTDAVIEQIHQNSARYPQELLAVLANNPEMADFVVGYPGESKGSAGGLTASEMEEDFPLFLQWDTRWGYQAYGKLI